MILKFEWEFVNHVPLTGMSEAGGRGERPPYFGRSVNPTYLKILNHGGADYAHQLPSSVFQHSCFLTNNGHTCISFSIIDFFFQKIITLVLK